MFMDSFYGYFVPCLSDKKSLDDIITLKYKNNQRVNIFFSTNYVEPNYYHLAQLLFLKELDLNKNTFFYICLNDTLKNIDLFQDALKKSKGVKVEGDLRGFRSTSEIIDELKSFLIAMGFEENRFYIFSFTEAWKRFNFVMVDKNIDLFKSVSSFQNINLKLSDEFKKLYYVSHKTDYNLGYILQKHLELFIGEYFDSLYPEEVVGSMDLKVLSYSGLNVTEPIRKILIKGNLVQKNIPVIYTNDLPCFGFNSTIDLDRALPTWNMDIQQIHKIINNYKVSSKDIDFIFESLINKYLNEFIFITKDKEIKQTKYLNLSKLSIKQKRLIFAHNLHAFLNKLKDETYGLKSTKFLSLGSKQKLYEYSSILHSHLAMDVLFLADGSNSISDIAKKLDKHISQISLIVSKLKDKKLVKINEKSKIERLINSIKIEFY